MNSHICIHQETECFYPMRMFSCAPFQPSGTHYLDYLPVSELPVNGTCGMCSLCLFLLLSTMLFEIHLSRYKFSSLFFLIAEQYF
jgi:hypothetical protein